MAACRNPFALKNGKIILIDDLPESERGLNCGCVCPACGDKFIARLGDVLVHHFAHSNNGCSESLAYTTGLYMMLKQLFDDRCPFYIPSLVIGCFISPFQRVSIRSIEKYIRILPETTESNKKIVIAKGKYITFDSAKFSYDNKNQIQALELFYNDRVMAIKVTPPKTVCKTGTVTRHKNFPTIEMDFRENGDLIQKASSKIFLEYISNSKNLSRWIYNEKIKLIYPQIVEQNNSKFGEQIKKHNEQKEIKKENKIEEEKFLNEYITLALKEKREKDGYEQVKNLFVQQEDIVYDKYNTRWVQCEICGEIKTDNNFVSYGGKRHINLGKCYKCSAKDK